MKKWVFILVIVAAAAVAFGYYAINNFSELAKLPYRNTLVLDNVAKAISDEGGNLYLIHQSKQSIAKLSADGTVAYRLEAPVSKEEALYTFGDITVDEQGRLYALITELDAFGLYVKGERIVRYDNKGNWDREIASYSYRGKDAPVMYRTGKVKGLRSDQSSVYYYTIDNSAVTLHLYEDNAKESAVEFEANLDKDIYIAGITGTKPGQIYYSSKRGDIYRLDENLASVQLTLPVHGQDELFFPTLLRQDDRGALFFFELHSQTVYRRDAANNIADYVKWELKTESGSADLSDVTGLYPANDGSLLITMSDRIYQFDSTGRLIAQTTEARYSSGETRHGYLVWGAALLAVLLLFAAVVLVYVKIMKRRLSIIFKQILVFVPIIVLSMAVLSYIIFTSFTGKMKSDVEAQLQLLAHNGQLLIDGDRLEQLKRPADYMSDAYREIKNNKDSLFAVSGIKPFERDGIYTTLYRVQGDSLYVVMDDDDSVNIFKPFESTEENEQVIREQIVSSGEFEDANGLWIYAIGPVMNSKGDTVGIYEVGKDMNGLAKHQRALLGSVIESISIITVIIVIVFLIMTFYLLSSIRILRRSVNDMASGKWDTVVEIGTKDEVSDLGDRFNFMSRQIRNYIAEVTEMSESYFRFVPQQFMKFLGKDSILDIKLGDQVQKDMSILVANIRDFYAMSKQMTPEQNFNFINSFLKRMGPAIRSQDGIVNKYLGAGVLALFPESADSALQASVIMRGELEMYNAHRERSGYKPIEMGIALHKGPLMLGIIGEEKRIDGGVLSDDVNVTSILEHMTGELGSSILITEEFRAALQTPDAFEYRKLGKVELPGLAEPMELYDVFHGDVETVRKLKRKTKAQFEDGIVFYQAGRFFDARECFLEVIKQNRQDKAAKLYFYICDGYFQRGAEDSWRGTLTITA